MTAESELRITICEAGRLLYARNLVAASDGNISARLDHDRYLCTPSGISKGFMHPDQLVIADGRGARIAGSAKVTSEFFTHLAAYQERPDVAAVVHAHPPYAVALTLAGVSLTDAVLPELVYSLREVPTAPYATPATPEGATAIRPLIRNHDAVLLDRHGAVTVGHTVLDAYFKMEKLEHAAQTLYHARLLGPVKSLPAEEVAKLHAVGEEYASQE